MCEWRKVPVEFFKQDFDMADEKYTKREAILDLILSANREPKMWQGELIEAGCFVTSLGKLSQKWGWNKNTIRTFFRRRNIPYFAVANVSRTALKVNVGLYLEYQGLSMEAEREVNAKRTRSERHTKSKIKNKSLSKIPKGISAKETRARRTTKKASSKETNKKPVEIPKSLDTEKFRVAWSEFVQHRKDIKKPLSELAAKKSLNSLEPFGVDWSVARIDEAIAKGWRGLVYAEDKQKLSTNGNGHHATEGYFDGATGKWVAGGESNTNGPILSKRQQADMEVCARWLKRKKEEEAKRATP